MTKKKRQRKVEKKLIKSKDLNIKSTNSKIVEKENIFSCISIFISLITLIITGYIGFEANNISRRNQDMDYKIHINQIQTVLSAKSTNDGVIYNTEDIKIDIKNKNNGLLKSVFVATVNEEKVDISYIESTEEKVDQNLNDEELRIFQDKTIITPVNFSNDNMTFNLIPPLYKSTWGNINKQLNTIHIVFKGYNNSIRIYSIVYVCVKGIEQIDPCIYMSYMRFYVLDDDTLYDYNILNDIAREMNKYNEFRNIECDEFTNRFILDELKKERKLIYDELKYDD